MSQFELLKKLEYLVAFQANCLNEGNWDTFDEIENEIEKIEKELLIFRS